MKTIKERAKEYADNFVVGDSAIIVELMHKVAEDSYIKGATEQKQVDIDKACEWWTNYLAYPTDTDEDRERVKEMVSEFIKGMDNDKGRTD